jgi:hypothetical protein
LVVVVVGGGTIYGRRQGYNFGGEVVVRCSAGHLFTTLWVPGASIKAIRLGRVRIQHCPVGHHWAQVVPIRDDDLSEEERLIASHFRDRGLP